MLKSVVYHLLSLIFELMECQHPTSNCWGWLSSNGKILMFKARPPINKFLTKSMLKDVILTFLTLLFNFNKNFPNENSIHRGAFLPWLLNTTLVWSTWPWKRMYFVKMGCLNPALLSILTSILLQIIFRSQTLSNFSSENFQQQNIHNPTHKVFCSRSKPKSFWYSPLTQFRTLIFKHTRTHTHTHTHTHTLTNSHKHTNTYIRKHTHMNTHTHMFIHTHTHTHVDPSTRKKCLWNGQWGFEGCERTRMFVRWW